MAAKSLNESSSRDLVYRFSICEGPRSATARSRERKDFEAELRKPDAIAAFSVRQRKSFLAGLEAMILALQECVRRGPEQITRRSKTGFPTLQFRHESFQSRSAW
jgi:hypothetical protein